MGAGYAALFSAFGFASPFLPAFLAGRGLGPEELGFVLGAATALRLIWLSATALLATPIAASFVPPFPAKAARDNSNGEIPHRPWLTLLRQRAFVRVTLVAALVLGSHAMYDSFAVIRWTQAGVSPATVGVLWAESVAAEVLVFLFLGPRLLRVVTPAAALAVAASSGLMRWAVMAQTADVAALGLVQPLHGFTFALLHLASMRIITDTVPRALAATAQAVYGLVGVGGATAVLMLLSGWLYARFGPAGFWAMGALHGRIPRHLAAASGACVVRSSAPAAHVSSLSFAPIGGKRTTDIVTLLDCPFAFRRTRPCDDDIDIAANKFGYDAGILLASRPGVTTSDRGTVRSVYRRTSLPRGGRQVLGANLNCSESRRALTAQPRIAYQMRQPLPKEPHSA